MSTMITFKDLIQDHLNQLPKEAFLEHLEASLVRLNATYAKDAHACDTLRNRTFDILTFAHTALFQGLSKYSTDFKIHLQEYHVKYGSKKTFLTRITYLQRYTHANTYQDSYLYHLGFHLHPCPHHSYLLVHHYQYLFGQHWLY